ncbi:uncharacterized protein LOC142620736 [Castanea sativa]|uniref:uncharacterized protein LOC142620736 n=1 Tax=Castanea sativa TaxID=21020 RepID=UPI003F64C345
MAQKEEKKKQKQKQQAPANKEAKNSRPWPELPHQLIKLIASQPSLEQGINFGSVTKSWRAAPKKCINPNATQPWLQIFNTDTHQCKMTKPYNSDNPFQGFWKRYLGCTNGILVAKGATCYILWNPIQRSWIISLYGMPGTSHPAFMFHRQGIGGENFEWIKQDCSLVDPHAPDKSRKHYMQFTNVIGLRGKFYALTLQGTLAVIVEVDSHLKITSLAIKRAIPSVSSRHFREYLVESNGEILLIFLISKKSIDVVDDVEVFGLNFVRLSWIKTESLGDQTLFVGENCCVSVSASKVGCKSNCLYFHSPIMQMMVGGYMIWKAVASLKGGVIPILRQNHHGLE